MELIVSEKYNAAERIAGILSKDSATRETVSGVTVFKWGGTYCMGLAGHVVKVDFPDEYNDWGSVSPASLVDVEITKRASKPDIVSALNTLASEADRVIIATDYDREGELIGKEAYDLVRAVNDTAPVDRVRFSSLTGPEVRNAFEDPDEIDFDLAAAGEARQRIDLRWGASLTRFLTLASNQRGDGFISVGRVQTPTLKLLVDREREIEDFDPDDYWEIYADLGQTLDGDSFEAQYFFLNDQENEAERLWDEETANAVYRDVDDASEATVETVDESTRNDNPPIPFNTTEFIKAANAIGYDAKPAMNVAEDLYDDGYVTYPRTDNTVYPDDLDPRELLETLSEASPFEADAEALLDQESISPTAGETETTDHPPIHPTEDVPKKKALKGREWEIYELIVRRFFATLADAATWRKLRVDVDVEGHSLKANGSRLVDPGYHAVYPYYDTGETTIPAVAEGDALQIVESRLDEKQTRPPNRYGQSQLVEKMESLGLGTKSTRHNTIEKLYDRDYVTGNPPEPTDLARKVVSATEEYGAHVASAEMTAQLEADMTAIADGGTTLDDVTGSSREMLEDVFDDLQRARDEIGELLRAEIDESDSVGDCPECGEPLLPRQANSGSRFVGCNGYPDCEFTLPLPNKGRPHILDELCDDHGLHHVKMIAGSKTFVFGCPRCQQRDAADTDDRVIGDCPECHAREGGELAIKRVHSGSRLVGCTRYPDCEYSLPLPREGEIEVTDDVCGDHDLPEVVVHQEDSSPWQLGCPICNYERYKN
ncbi:DNA topoisomerase I [Halobacteria archaeon HArc-gm2]|nr:DNA topoisomerase I [Halobacteria archaeon HArc-gm2]